MDKTLNNERYFKKYLNFFKIFIRFCIIHSSLLSECLDVNNPIKKNNANCMQGNCELSEYESGVCTIENDIIKTQWLTSIVHFAEEWYTYTLITTTESGDLIVSSTKFNEPKTLYYYYGLKKMVDHILVLMEKKILLQQFNLIEKDMKEIYMQ